MKTKKKILVALALVGCAILLVAGSIAGTMAYLTSTTETVKNTFTVGNVAITLDETDVDLYGVKEDGEARVTENQYKLIPGHTYVKDPTIHVAKGSEKCYLFVKVENNLGNIETADAAKTIKAQMTANGWLQIESNSDIWYYNNDADNGNGFAVDASGVATDVDVFGEFTVADNAVLPTNVEALAITVTAYAIQADGFDTAAEAWAAAPASFAD